MLQKLQDTIKKSKPITFILVMTLYSFISLVIFIPLILYIDRFDPLEGFSENYGKFEFFFLATLLAPIFETFVYQYLIIEIMGRAKKFIPMNDVVIILISAFVFGLSHTDSYSYMLAAFISGVVLAHIYFIARAKKYSPFLSTAVVHSLRNGIVFLISLITP